MTGGAAVGVDDDLAAREPRVPHRAPDHEAAGRVHVHEVLVLEPCLVVHVARQDRVEDALDQIRLDQRLRVEIVGVLGRDEHPLDLDRTLPAVLVDLVANRDLRLAVGPQVLELVGLAHLREALADAVRERDRQRHELVGFTTRVPEHHPLVAGAELVERIVVGGIVLRLERGVDALRNVLRLLVDRDEHAARIRVEPVVGARVADLRDLGPRDAWDVDVGRRRDLAADENEPRRQEGLARDPRVRILGEDGVEDAVGDLVSDLVGVALRYGLGGEMEAVRWCPAESRAS